MTSFYNGIAPFCRCCGQEGKHVRRVPVEPVHPTTDRALESLELCRPCFENAAATWRMRWKPASPSRIAA